ncbi:uncharacterized protein [Argopecten irradians]|uniref:uncharacterized protein n=1 Tax=Argopecten irradians TaxID=31199 RepID=UPI0037146933
MSTNQEMSYPYSNSGIYEIHLFEECELHPGESLRLVCLDCEECICNECYRFIHSSHRRQELEEYNRTQLEVLKNYRQKLNELTKVTKGETSCLGRQIKRCDQKCVLAVKEAEAAFNTLLREIMARKEDMVRTMKGNTSEFINQLTQQKEELEHRLKQFDLICKRIETVTKSNDPGVFFRSVGGLKKHCLGAINQKQLVPPPIFMPQFRGSPTLSSEIKTLQIGSFVNIENQKDDDSEERVYEITDDDYVYEIDPFPVDSLNTPNKESDITNKHRNLVSCGSSGSSYCQQSGPEMKVNQATYPEKSSDSLSSESPDSLSAGSSYAVCSKAVIAFDHDDQKRNGKFFTSMDESPAYSSAKSIKNQEEETCTENMACNDLLGQYSLARTDSPSTGHHSPLDDGNNTDVYNAIDDHHIADDEYERLLPRADDPPPLRVTNKYQTFHGSTVSLDRTIERAKMPQRFQLNFNTYKRIPTEDTILHGTTLKRVFLPFSISGFAEVPRDNDVLLAFVTTENEVVIIRKNGVEYARIRELTSPFDVSSSRCSPYNLYITDRGACHGLGSVRVYSCGGRYLDTFIGSLKAPRGIDVAEDGNVFVCDEDDRCVRGFSPKGRNIFSLNIHGVGFPMYVRVLSERRLAVCDHSRDNLIVHPIDSPNVEFRKTKLHGSFCRGMCYEDADSGQEMLYIVHPEVNCLHVIRKDQHDVICLGTDRDTRPLVPWVDEMGNVLIF